MPLWACLTVIQNQLNIGMAWFEIKISHSETNMLTLLGVGSVAKIHPLFYVLFITVSSAMGNLFTIPHDQ